MGTSQLSKHFYKQHGIYEAICTSTDPALVHGKGGEQGDKKWADLFKNKLEPNIMAAQRPQTKVSVSLRAPSTYQNCNCQCDSYQVSRNNQILGNCQSPDSNGILFCYVSGDALCSCRDVQPSSWLNDSNGQPRYYSYEACATAARNQCQTFNSNGLDNNLGPNDFPYCPQSQYQHFWQEETCYRRIK